MNLYKTIAWYFQIFEDIVGKDLESQVLMQLIFVINVSVLSFILDLPNVYFLPSLTILDSPSVLSLSLSPNKCHFDNFCPAAAGKYQQNQRPFCFLERSLENNKSETLNYFWMHTLCKSLEISRSIKYSTIKSGILAIVNEGKKKTTLLLIRV